MTVTSAERAQQLLCVMFAELLEREQVLADDDFFVLGGHSLLVTRLVNKVRDVFGVDLPVTTMFENSTPAKLAFWLANGRCTRPAITIRPRLRRAPS